jgi:DNA-binding transcriptional ArsR family regulator
MQKHAGNAACKLRGLANEHRLMILCALADGEQSVKALNQRIDLSQSALSQHLAVLRQQGLVQTRRDAQNVYYFLGADEVLQVVQTLYHIYCKPGPIPSA